MSWGWALSCLKMVLEKDPQYELTQLILFNMNEISGWQHPQTLPWWKGQTEAKLSIYNKYLERIWLDRKKQYVQDSTMKVVLFL